MRNLHAFEKIFFSLIVDYDVIDHVILGWLEECSPRKNKSRLWTLQDSAERSLVPKFVRLLWKKPCLNMPYERAWNFDQRKTFSENYKPMRVWLWSVYKFTKNCCRSRLFSEFIQTQKRYLPLLIKCSYQAKIILVN